MWVVLICLLIAVGAQVTIEMIEAPTLGDNFYQYTEGKHVVCLLWSSQVVPERMFKMSKWNMLATEKDKWAKGVEVVDVDCAQTPTLCQQLGGENEIVYSYNNEPFKIYSDSREYPSLCQFLHDYFERECLRNVKYCTEKQNASVAAWQKMSLWQLIEAHIDISRRADGLVADFEEFAVKIKKLFDDKQEEVELIVKEQDSLANLLLHEIHKHPANKVNETLQAIKNASAI